MIIGAIHVKEDGTKEYIEYENPFPFPSSDSEEFRKKQENMTPKYYTPSIEEFHDQFEYEEKQFIWEKRIFDFRDLEIIHDELSEGKIRVKHLDREGIESLKWNSETILLENDEGEDMYSSGFSISTDENNFYELVMMENDKVYIQKKWYRNSVTQLCRSLYYGNIKNKSELKKLMQQLGIN